MTLMRKTFALLGGIALALPLLVGAVSDWQSRVPAAERTRANPLGDDADAITAGHVLYSDHCAQCHGADGEGRGHHPAVDTPRVANASDGELFWLLTNGSHGMPAWARLPAAERWQIIRFVRSLPAAPSHP